MSKKLPKIPAVRWTEQEVVAALAKRHPAPEWAFFPQLRNGTGFAQLPRTADAVAMNCYPSRGLEVHGFEVKTSRNDFLNELKNPDKAESIAKYCDRWWLVVSDPTIVKTGELPATWGQLSMHGGVLRIDAPALPLTPIPLDRLFVASLLRNQAYCPDEEVKKQYAEGMEYGKKCVGGDYKRLREEVDKFEAVSGVKIADRWSLGNVALAVKALTEMEYEVKHIASAAKYAREIADALDLMLKNSGLTALATELKEKGT